MTIGADGMQRIRELEAEIARLRQALDDFGEHKRSCKANWFGVNVTPCTCGLDAARQRQMERMETNDTDRRTTQND